MNQAVDLAYTDLNGFYIGNGIAKLDAGTQNERYVFGWGTSAISNGTIDGTRNIVGGPSLDLDYFIPEMYFNSDGFTEAQDGERLTFGPGAQHIFTTDFANPNQLALSISGRYNPDLSASNDDLSGQVFGSSWIVPSDLAEAFGHDTDSPIHAIETAYRFGTDGAFEWYSLGAFYDIAFDDNPDYVGTRLGVGTYSVSGFTVALDYGNGITGEYVLNDSLDAIYPISFATGGVDYGAVGGGAMIMDGNPGDIVVAPPVVTEPEPGDSTFGTVGLVEPKFFEQTGDVDLFGGNTDGHSIKWDLDAAVGFKFAWEPKLIVNQNGTHVFGIAESTEKITYRIDGINFDTGLGTWTATEIGQGALGFAEEPAHFVDDFGTLHSYGWIDGVAGALHWNIQPDMNANISEEITTFDNGMSSLPAIDTTLKESAIITTWGTPIYVFRSLEGHVWSLFNNGQGGPYFLSDLTQNAMDNGATDARIDSEAIQLVQPNWTGLNVYGFQEGRFKSIYWSAEFIADWFFADVGDAINSSYFWDTSELSMDFKDDAQAFTGLIRYNDDDSSNYNTAYIQWQVAVDKWNLVDLEQEQPQRVFPEMDIRRGYGIGGVSKFTGWGQDSEDNPYATALRVREIAFDSAGDSPEFYDLEFDGAYGRTDGPYDEIGFPEQFSFTVRVDF